MLSLSPTPTPNLEHMSWVTMVIMLVLFAIVVIVVVNMMSGRGGSNNGDNSRNSKRVRRSIDGGANLADDESGGNVGSLPGITTATCDSDFEDNSDSESEDGIRMADDTHQRDTVRSIDIENGKDYPSKVVFESRHLRNRPSTPSSPSGRELVLREIMEKGKVVCKFIVINGECALPGSKFEQWLNLESIEMEKVPHGGVYYILPNDSFEQYNGKGGRSTDCRERGKKYPGRKGIVLFDYDYATNATVGKLQKYLKLISDMDGISLGHLNTEKIKNLTLEEVNKMESEEKSLSMIIRLVLHSMHTPVDEFFGSGVEKKGVSSASPSQEDDDGSDDDPLVAMEEGGAKSSGSEESDAEEDEEESPPPLSCGMKGVDRAWHLNLAESIIQMLLLMTAGVLCESKSMVHEHLQFSALDWINEANAEVMLALVAFFEALVTVTSEDWVYNQVHQVKASSSWAPRIPHNESSATCLIYNALFNNALSKQLRMWWDIFKDTPRECDDNNDKISPYDSKKGYNDEQRKAARKKQLDSLKALMILGGFMLFDVANEAYRGLDYTFLNEAQRLGFEPFFRYLSMVALVYKSDDGKYSVIIVHDPLCDIFRSSSGSWIPFHEVVAQAKKAMTAHLIQAIIDRLQTPSDDRRTLKTRMLIFGNFLFAFAMRVFLLFNLHTQSMVATHFGKAMLCCLDTNIFQSSKHGLQASPHGFTKKAQDKSRRDLKRGEESFTKDDQIRPRLVRYLTRARPSMEEDEVDEIFDGMIDLLKCSVPSEDSSQEGKERRFDEMCRILVRFKDEQLLLPAGNHIYTTLNDKLALKPIGRLQDGIIAGAPSAAASTQQNNDIHANLAASNAKTGFAGFPPASPP